MGTWEEAVLWLQRQPEQAQLVRDCYYDPPLVDAARRFHTSEEWEATRRWFPRGHGRALDLGAGHGIASYALASDGWETTALEPDRSSVVGAGAIREIAKSTSMPIRVVAQQGERLPFRSNTFDLVYARQVLHHAADLRLMCAEVRRVLRPGGIFVATREHVISSSEQLSQFQAAHPLHWMYGGEYAYAAREYVAALRTASLAVRRVYGSFDSVVNYAPFTRTTLRAELARKLRRVPGGFVLEPVLRYERGLDLALRTLSIIDRRPGRLISIVSERPGGKT